MDRQKPTTAIPVESYTHTEATRANIPTEELRDFVADDGATPPLRYPRDPSLDPQLVWKGKEEQDADDLSVPVVPIYIQEKIQPRAIVEEVRAQARTQGQTSALPSLFSDFNGIAFERLIDFYNNQQHWTNRMILGDSLLVMTSLAEKERLKGKVQMIYMDPPYGIKFGSNWQVSTRKRDVKDGKADDLTRQPEQIKAFRDTWELGIHSYLTYLRDRLTVARDLLTESGSVFVQIGDENVHLVRNLLDEVFGSENFVSLIAFNKTSGAGSPAIGTLVLASVSDYIIWYAKSKEKIKFRQLYQEKDESTDPGGKYSYAQLADGMRTTLARMQQNEQSSDAVFARIFRLDNMTSQASPQVPYEFQGRTYVGGWKTNGEGLMHLSQAGRIAPSANILNYVRFLDDFPAMPINNAWMDIGGIQSRVDPKIYVVQTNVKAVQRCMLMTTDPGDLVVAWSQLFPPLQCRTYDSVAAV